MIKFLQKLFPWRLVRAGELFRLKNAERTWLKAIESLEHHNTEQRKIHTSQ